MKIAATYDEGNIFPNFGMAGAFKVYTVEDGAVVSGEVKAVDEGCHMDAFPGLMAEWGVEKVLTGGIAYMAQKDLQNLQIEVLTGAGGDADGQVQAYLKGLPLGNPCGDCGHIDPDTGSCAAPDDHEHKAGQH